MTVINEYALETFAAELRTRIAGREYTLTTIRSRTQIHDPHEDAISMAVNQAHLDELEDMLALTTRLVCCPSRPQSSEGNDGLSPWKSQWDSHIAQRFGQTRSPK